MKWIWIIVALVVVYFVFIKKKANSANQAVKESPDSGTGSTRPKGPVDVAGKPVSPVRPQSPVRMSSRPYVSLSRSARPAVMLGNAGGTEQSWALGMEQGGPARY